MSEPTYTHRPGLRGARLNEYAHYCSDCGRMYPCPGALEEREQAIATMLEHQLIINAGHQLDLEHERKHFVSLMAERDSWRETAETLGLEVRRLRQRNAALEALVGAFGPTLQQHWLAGIECDHSTKQDRPSCACGEVDFGWWPSVGEAVRVWSEHVLEEVEARKLVGPEGGA